MTTTIQEYLINGCKRCELGGTPQCKIHRWVACIELIRPMLTAQGLKEEVKWGAPCYTFEGKNVAMISALKDACVLGFFKGTLIKDPENLLKSPGPNSHEARQFKFTSLEEIESTHAYILACIKQAIEIERKGLTVNKEAVPEAMPPELIDCFADDSELQAAFETLTPGRKRGYLIHFNQAKQSDTRLRRIEKWRPHILKGKGMHDR